MCVLLLFQVGHCLLHHGLWVCVRHAAFLVHGAVHDHGIWGWLVQCVELDGSYLLRFTGKPAAITGAAAAVGGVCYNSHAACSVLKPVL